MTSADGFAACTVAPTPAEQAVFRKAVARCRALGLVFFPGEVEVKWFTDDETPGAPWGWTFFKERPVRVFLRRVRGATEKSQFGVVVHELEHAWSARDLDLDIETREQRAEAFARRCVELEYPDPAVLAREAEHRHAEILAEGARQRQRQAEQAALVKRNQAEIESFAAARWGRG